MKRQVSIKAAKHLLGKLEGFRKDAAAKFRAPTYTHADRESFVLSMLEGSLQYYADPVKP